VKGGQEVYPDDVAGVVFLRRQNICKEVVPVKEPPTSEHVQNIKDGGTVVENHPRHSMIPSGLIRLLIPIFQGQRRDLKGGGSDKRGRGQGQGGGKFLSLLWSLGRQKGRRRQRRGSNRHRPRHRRVRMLGSSLRGHGGTNAKRDGGGKRSRRDAANDFSDNHWHRHKPSIPCFRLSMLEMAILYFSLTYMLKSGGY